MWLGDKTFRITEMPLQQADEWATPACLPLVKGGLDIGNVNVDLIKTLLIQRWRASRGPNGRHSWTC